VVLFFCGVAAARIFISAISSGVKANLLVFFFGFCFLSFFCGVSGIMELLLPKICWLISSSEDMSVRYSTAEDSWVLKRLNWVDPDKVSDYLCPSPVSRPSSLHRGVKRGRASSEPLPGSAAPVSWRRKRVGFSLGKENKVVEKRVEKSPAGFVWGGPVLRHQGKKLGDIPWSQRVFTPKYVVQC